MSGRLLQVIGVATGIVGFVLSLTFGILGMGSGTAKASGVGILLGGMLGSLIGALTTFAVGTTLVKVTNIEEMLEGKYAEKSNDPLEDKKQEENTSKSHAINDKATEVYKNINRLDDVDTNVYMSAICPGCKNKLSIEKRLVEAGEPFTCPYCEKVIKRKV